MAEENTNTEVVTDEQTLNVDSAVADIWSGMGMGNADDPAPDDDDGKEETPAAAKATDVPAADEIPVPDSWAKEVRELWATVPAAARKQIQLREKQMLDGLEQYKEHNAFGRTLREVMTPYKALLAEQGVDEAKAVQYLLSSHARLSDKDVAKRVEYFQTIAKHYGVDLAALTANAATAAQVPPEVRALREELDGIKNTLTTREQASLNEARARVTKDVEAFASDKDRAYFDEVSADMLPFLQAGMELKDAYDKAVWANPVTRAKEMARIHTETETKLKENARLDALKARKAAGANVRSRDTVRTPTEPLGKMEDTMRDALKEIKERVH